MGYYSCSLLVFSPTGRKKFYKHLRSTPNDLQEEVRSFLRCADKFKEHNGSILFYWKNYKWDDGYDFVPFLYDFLQQLEKNNYLFVRYGEYLLDITILGSYTKDFDCKFSRKISVDGEIFY